MFDGILMAAAAAATTPAEVQMHTDVFNEFSRWVFIYQTWLEVDVLILAAMFLLFKPYFPFMMSRIITHRPVVGVMTRVRNIIPLGGFTLRNGMYRKELRENVMYFVKKYVGSYFIGGVPFDMVHIDQAQVQDPFYNRYIYTLRQMGYKQIDGVRDALEFSTIDPAEERTQEIVESLGYSSYEEAKRDLNPSGLTPQSEIYAPLFSNVPQDELLDFGWNIPPGSVAAQVSDTIEFRQPPIEQDKLRDMMPFILLIICFAIGIAIIMSQMHK